MCVCVRESECVCVCVCKSECVCCENPIALTNIVCE